jgi:5-methylcytosine-specific restriction endonuclease McrA
MGVAIRNAVRRRAGSRCEYCGLPQEVVSRTTFHIEHITAKQHGGTDDPNNLALACDRCNLFKGPNLTSLDPLSGDLVLLLNPRRDKWSAHFAQRGAEIVGLTRVDEPPFDSSK